MAVRRLVGADPDRAMFTTWLTTWSQWQRVAPGPKPSARTRSATKMLMAALLVGIAGLGAILGSSTSAGASAAWAQAEEVLPPDGGCGGQVDVAADEVCPVSVLVELDVFDIPRIDERAGVVEFDAWMSVFWFDDRLADACADDRLDIYQAERARDELKSMWWPDIVLHDGLGPRATSAFALNVGCGYAFYEERFLAEVRQDFENLHDFPFDEHELVFTLRSFAQPNDVVEFVSPAEVLDLSDDAEGTGSVERFDPTFEWKTGEWKRGRDDDSSEVVVINPFFDDVEFDEDGPIFDDRSPFFREDGRVASYYGDPDGLYASATFKITATRQWRFYVLNIVLPLVLIVALSWAVFWSNLGRMSLAERLGVSITSLLTVVAFDFLTGDSLPRLPYTTRLDAFYNFSYAIVAATVVVSILSTRMPQVERDDGRLAATWLDLRCRWVFPVLYLVATVLSLLGLFSRGRSIF